MPKLLFTSRKKFRMDSPEDMTKIDWGDADLVVYER